MLLFYQNKQLFTDSTGSDGKPLGWYRTNKHAHKGKSKGTPFKMYDTGALKRGMWVDVHRRHITFGSNRANPSAYEIQFSTTKDGGDKFATQEWWGLTDEHLARITNKYLTQWIRKYTLRAGTKNPM